MKINSQTVVAITGASRGIGMEAAYAFAKKGAKVVLASRDQEKMANVAERIKQIGSEVFIIPCDVSIEANCKKMISETISHFGRIDVLVNNAGFGHYAAIENLTTEALEKIFKTNLFGTIWCTQAALPQMKKQGKGHIVNVSTVISKRSLPFMTAYCMTKFAMNAFDEGLRLELRPFGIGVTLICPGLTNTDFQSNAGKAGFAPPLRNKGGMTAKKVGEVIVCSVQHHRRRVTLTSSGKFLAGFQRVSPFITDEIINAMFSTLGTRQEPRP